MIARQLALALSLIQQAWFESERAQHDPQQLPQEQEEQPDQEQQAGLIDASPTATATGTTTAPPPAPTTMK